MAKNNQHDIEILLEELDLSQIFHQKNSRHLVNSILLWPRILISSKTSVATVDLQKGKENLAELPWHKKILFKERVEHHFALHLDITESMTAQAFTNFFRSIASGIFRVGASAVEKALENNGVPDPLGEIGGLPLEYLQKKFKAMTNANIEATGDIDLNAAELTDNMQLQIPLLATKNVYEQGRIDYVKEPHRTRKCLVAKDSTIGSATISIHLLN